MIDSHYLRLPLLLILISFLLGRSVTAEESPQESPIVLPPVVTEASASEHLNEDVIVPPLISEEDVVSTTPRGSLLHELSRSLPLPLTDQGGAGALTQVRGMGRSAEETLVQALGVPLNLPQGGGADLSSFPDFFWSGYRFQTSGAHGGYDPRAVGGTLSLTPWTSWKIRKREKGSFIYQSAARRLGQSAFGISTGDVAVLGGYRYGDSKGPAAALSARLIKREKRERKGEGEGSEKSGHQLKAHLLGSQLETQLPLPAGFQSMGQWQRASRVIPVLDWSWKDARRNLEASHTFYWDGSQTESRMDSETEWRPVRATQLGTENFLSWRSYQLGLSLRRTGFSGAAFSAPEETLAHAKFSKLIQVGEWILDPAVQFDWTNELGTWPGGAFGARLPLSHHTAVYGRLAYVPKFPSLLSRYYAYTGETADWTYLQNPELRPERVWSLTIGHEWNNDESFFNRIQASLQWRDDVQLNAQTGHGIQVQNIESAYTAHLIHSLGWKPFAFLRLEHALDLAISRITATGQSFPYLPGVTEVFRLSYLSGARGLEATLFVRGVSESFSALGGQKLSGYVLTGIEVSQRLWSSNQTQFDLTAVVENIQNRKIEITTGYPLSGRSFSLGLTARL